jgi:hypothetical protein
LTNKIEKTNDRKNGKQDRNKEENEQNVSWWTSTSFTDLNQDEIWQNMGTKSIGLHRKKREDNEKDFKKTR